jgi:hypothetical protein
MLLLLVRDEKRELSTAGTRDRGFSQLVETQGKIFGFFEMLGVI